MFDQVLHMIENERVRYINMNEEVSCVLEAEEGKSLGRKGFHFRLYMTCKDLLLRLLKHFSSAMQLIANGILICERRKQERGRLEQGIIYENIGRILRI